MKLLIPTLLSVLIATAPVPQHSSNPSLSDCRSMVQKRIQGESKGVITVVDFKKSLEHEAENGGKKTYVMWFEGSIRFNSECYWRPDGGFQIYKSGRPTADDSRLGQKTRALSGEREEIVGRLYFVKERSGWKGQIDYIQVLLEPAAVPVSNKQGALLRANLINGLNNLAAKAQNYYRHPKAVGGGGESFAGFTLSGTDIKMGDDFYQIANGIPSVGNYNPDYAARAASNPQTVIIVGWGSAIGKDGVHNIEAYITVTTANRSPVTVLN